MALARVVALCGSARAQRVATATATVTDGVVTAITVTDGGAGYGSTPVVTLLGGGGTGAAAQAVIAGDPVIAINVTSGSSGYTRESEVVIESPLNLPTLLALQMIPLVTIHGMPGDTKVIQFSSTLGEGAV